MGADMQQKAMKTLRVYKLEYKGYSEGGVFVFIADPAA